MFENLNQRWLDGRQILSVDEFDCADGKHEQCGVHFADDKDPKVAVVHKDELKYLVFDNEKDSVEKRGLAFSTATESLQIQIMEAMRFYNLKYKELRKVTDNIGDTFQSIKERMDRAIFAGEDGKFNKFTLKLSRIIEVIGEHGGTIDYSGITEKGQVLFKALLDIDASFEDAKVILPSFVPFFNGALFSKACELTVGMTANEMRIRDMVDFVEAYEAIHGLPEELKESEPPVAIEPPAAELGVAPTA